MAVTEDRILDVVRTAVAEAMFVDKDEVQPDTTLFVDLGAESIDVLDILFRIERQTGVKIEIEDLSRNIQGGMPDDEFFDSEGKVTSAGLERLRTSMPQRNLDDLGSDVTGEDLMKQITVQYVADRVAEPSQSQTAEAS